jgi:4-aminobutyrate aminotransferase-like enzyme
MPCRHHLARRLGVFVVPLALAGSLLPAQAVLAQNDPQQFVQPEGSAFSEAQLESYAAAVLTVQEIDRAWQPKIYQAGSEAEAEAMTAQATDEMIGEIEGKGLSVEEYNAITQAAERDEQLYNRIIALLAEAQ